MCSSGSGRAVSIGRRARELVSIAETLVGSSGSKSTCSESSGTSSKASMRAMGSRVAYVKTAIVSYSLPRSQQHNNVPPVKEVRLWDRSPCPSS